MIRFELSRIRPSRNTESGYADRITLIQIVKFSFDFLVVPTHESKYLNGKEINVASPLRCFCDF